MVKPQKKMNLVILNFITILMLFTHPFTLLVVGSYLVFEVSKFYKKKWAKNLYFHDLSQ